MLAGFWHVANCNPRASAGELDVLVVDCSDGDISGAGHASKSGADLADGVINYPSYAIRPAIGYN